MISTDKQGESKPYFKSKTQQYWCHNCRKLFTKIVIDDNLLECVRCRSRMVEEVPYNPSREEENPQNYIPFNTPEHYEEHYEIIQIQTNSYLDEIVEDLLNLDYENEEIERIVNYLLLHDQNKYGNPPASKDSINNLKEKTVSKEMIINFGLENSCSICKDEFMVGNTCINLPCKHYFHKDCILPWLQEHNSCPVCRFELPTDDEDYEKMKKERMNTNSFIQQSN